MPPQRLLTEPISTGPALGHNLDRGKYEEMLEEYYTLRGWNAESGVPTAEKLRELGLPVPEEAR